MQAQTLAGISLAAISVALVVLSRIQLGKSFSLAPRAGELVTHGIYSRVRHPMYLFLDIAICGAALALHSWYVLLILVVLVPLQIRNARSESALLQAAFGERYENYRRSTWL